MRRTPACTICGQPAPRGARLCAPCRAALKRAGQRTVQDLPHYRDPVPRPRPRKRASSGAEHAEGAGARHARRAGDDTGRRVVLGTAAVAALAGVAYLGQPQWSAGNGGGEDGKVNEYAPLAAAAPAAADAALPVPAALPAMPAPAPAASALPRDPPAHTARNAPTAPRATPRTAKPPPRVEPPTPLPAYPSLDAFGLVAEAPRAPPPPAVAPRAAPPPDRWQRMRDALAQCEREGGFSGFLCDQRTRIDACDGYWGRVPQCPDMPENPR